MPEQYKNTPESVDDLDDEADPVEANKVTKSAEAAQQANLEEWWRTFGNSELIELIDRGLANNSDVRIATIRLAQAKSRSDQAHAGIFPTVTAPLGESVGSIPVGTGTAGNTKQKSYQASLLGNWRVDIWGEQSSTAESAKYQLWQAAFESDNVQRNMTAGLASNYIELLSLNDRLRLAGKTEAVLRSMLTATKVRVNVADATVNELDQQKMTFFSARSALHTLEQQRESALSSIAFMVGTVPESLKLSNGGLDALYLPSVVPALPSSLLFRRPDVRMAEARLLAADADVDVARARILPPLDLTSQAGYSGAAMAQLFQPSALFWNAISNVTVSIFDSGKLASQKENAQAVHEEMVENYARTIYQAVSEVENALSNIRLTSQRLNVQQKVTATARRAWGNSAEAYAIGSIDYMALLEARRAYYRQQEEYQQVRMTLFKGYISLFQSLGGGFSASDQMPGKGVRPLTAKNQSPGVTTKKLFTGVDWDAVPEDSSTPYWQVELSGLYHSATIDSTWRDLRTRYSKQMKNLFLRPRLQGKVEDSTEGRMAWYRLYISKFATPDSALELCATLQANYQRCRVVSSQSDETVVASPATKGLTGALSDPVKSLVPSAAVKNVAPANIKTSLDKG